MLLSPLLLTTIPVRVFDFRSCIFDIQLLFHFPQHSFNSGNITFNISYGFAILQLLRNRLRSQIKQMPLELLEFAPDFIGAQFAVMLRFHTKLSFYNECLRLTNLHLTGILCATLTKACFATFSLTPPISKQTWPGLTLATQNSGSPLPLPIRVSNGLALTGLCGNTLR